MSWRETQRKHRKRIAQSIQARLRLAWKQASPQEKIAFLADLEAEASTPAVREVFREQREAARPTYEPEPEIPAFNAIARDRGNPLAYEDLSATGLIPVYRDPGGE